MTRRLGCLGHEAFVHRTRPGDRCRAGRQRLWTEVGRHDERGLGWISGRRCRWRGRRRWPAADRHRRRPQRRFGKLEPRRQLWRPQQDRNEAFPGRPHSPRLIGLDERRHQQPALSRRRRLRPDLQVGADGPGDHERRRRDPGRGQLGAHDVSPGHHPGVHCQRDSSGRIRPNNAAAIATAIAGATSATGGVVSYGNTPTRNAENAATAYLSTLTDGSTRYILLATDGIPTCPASGEAGLADSAGAIGRRRGRPRFGVPDVRHRHRDRRRQWGRHAQHMANAGGLPRAGTPSYYSVASAADLAAALRTLVRVAATCTFQIGPTPTSDGSTSLDRIDVFGDGDDPARPVTHQRLRLYGREHAVDPGSRPAVRRDNARQRPRGDGHLPLHRRLMWHRLPARADRCRAASAAACAFFTWACSAGVSFSSSSLMSTFLIVPVKRNGDL